MDIFNFLELQAPVSGEVTLTTFTESV